MDHISPSTGRSLPRIKGGFLMVSALATAGLGWFILNLLPGIAEKLSGGEQDLHPLARFCIHHRPWIPLLVLPGFLCGVLILRTPRSSLARMWLLVGTLTLILSVALIFFCFIMTLAPAYQYQPL